MGDDHPPVRVRLVDEVRPDEHDRRAHPADDIGGDAAERGGDDATVAVRRHAHRGIGHPRDQIGDGRARVIVLGQDRPDARVAGRAGGLTEPRRRDVAQLLVVGERSRHQDEIGVEAAREVRRHRNRAQREVGAVERHHHGLRDRVVSHDVIVAGLRRVT